MSNRSDRTLLRYLRRELSPPEAEELERRLGSDGELRDRLERLQGVWESLELPPAAPVPPGFAQRVVARATEKRAPGLLQAPVWVRAVGAAALGLGVLLGALAGQQLPAREPGSIAVERLSSELTTTEEMSFAESYLLALEPESGAQEVVR